MQRISKGHGIIHRYDGYGLIHITAEQIRETVPSIIICRDDEDRAEGHVLACGPITRSLARKLQLAAKWEDGYLPVQVDPRTNQPMPTDPTT